ncbi:hypothetical protein FBU30_005010 [Linnemannia zychae]|nr:hypothetical protein FBU30_005010 [Linnemannia zychae]
MSRNYDRHGGALMMPGLVAKMGGNDDSQCGGLNSGGIGSSGGVCDGGDGSSNDRLRILELGKLLHAEEYEDIRSESCYVLSVPDWETIRAGILPTSKPARDALMAAIVLALITIGLEAILLHRHKVMTAELTGPTGMAYEISYFRPLMVFAVGLLWDAAIHKNSLQLVAFTLFEWCLVSYSGLQIWQHDQLMKDIGIPNEVLSSLGDRMTQMILFSQLGFQVAACLGITLLTWRLYSEFGWLVFQKLGADVSLRMAALTDKHWQKGLEEIAFAIPLSGIIIFLGYCALRNENKVTMGGFISCLGLLIAYMTYRIVALHQTLTGDASTDPYFFSRKTMTVFASLTLIMTVLALVNAIVMLYNFNKGLKEAMQQYRVKRSGTIRSVTPSIRRSSANHGLRTSSVDIQNSSNGGGGGGGGNGANEANDGRIDEKHIDDRHIGIQEIKDMNEQSYVKESNPT